MIKWYYEDQAKTQVDTVIAACTCENGVSAVQFAESLFYPQGGGQKGDRGVFVLEGVEYVIVKTVKDEGFNSVCLVEGELPADCVGKAVSCRLDAAYRDRQTRLHSCLHVYHMIAEQVLGAELQYPTLSTIEAGFAVNKYNGEAMTDEVLEVATARFLEFIKTDTPARTFADAEDPNRRYWQCGECVIPCGGTHVARMDAIGAVTVATKRKKGQISVQISLAE